MTIERYKREYYTARKEAIPMYSSSETETVKINTERFTGDEIFNQINSGIAMCYISS